MTLDLTSLKKAVHSFEKAIKIYQQLPIQYSMGEDEINLLKSRVVQNFEFTYELCWKFMKRWLEENTSDTFNANVSRKQLFRYAGEYLLISDFNPWLKYHEMRNQTSHTYDVVVADEILKYADSLLLDAKKLLAELEQKND